MITSWSSGDRHAYAPLPGAVRAWVNTGLIGGQASTGLRVTPPESRFLDEGVRVELFTLDTTGIDPTAGSVQYFTPSLDNSGNIVWQGRTYSSVPIEASGFELTSQGSLPRPKVRISNAHLVLQSAVNTLGDLVGATITRTKTYEKYLDGKPAADPNMHYPVDVFRVEEKTAHNKVFVEWTLASVVDQQGTKLPRRQVLANACDHIYRRYDSPTGQFDYGKATCPYVGSAIFDAQGNVVAAAALDRCGKQRRDCSFRFPDDPLPTHAFFGAGRLRRQ